MYWRRGLESDYREGVKAIWVTVVGPVPSETQQSFACSHARFMPPTLPIDQGALVYFEDLAALDRRHLQIKPALLYLLADVPGMSRI